MSIRNFYLPPPTSQIRVQKAHTWKHGWGGKKRVGDWGHGIDVKKLAAKMKDLSLMPRTHMVERENRWPQVVL